MGKKSVEAISEDVEQLITKIKEVG